MRLTNLNLDKTSRQTYSKPDRPQQEDRATLSANRGPWLLSYSIIPIVVT